MTPALSLPIATKELYRDEDVMLVKISVGGHVTHMLAYKAHVELQLTPAGPVQ